MYLLSLKSDKNRIITVQLLTTSATVSHPSDTVTDPGLPVGGVPTRGGRGAWDADLRHGHFSAKACENEIIGSRWEAPAGSTNASGYHVLVMLVCKLKIHSIFVIYLNVVNVDNFNVISITVIELRF